MYKKNFEYLNLTKEKAEERLKWFIMGLISGSVLIASIWILVSLIRG